MSKRDIEDIYPLSPMQQGMLFHSLSEPASGMYFEQSHWILQGKLDVPAFERAWQAAFDRHSALRTAFVWEGVDEPLQVVYKGVRIEIQREDWREKDKAEQQDLLRQFLADDRRRGFSLGEAPLMRLALLQTDATTHQFVWSQHHLQVDGWSMPLIVKEVLAFYEAARTGRPLVLRPVPQYREYIGWLRQRDRSRDREYWTGVLGDLDTTGSLPSLRSTPAIDGMADYAMTRFTLPQELSGAIQQFARAHQLTLTTVILGCWGVLLGKYTGEQDVVVGLTVSGRPPDLPGADSIVGLFINTLPVRLLLKREARVTDWLGRLQETLSEMREFEHTPLVEIHGWTRVPRTSRLFETLLVVENYPVDESLKQSEASLTVARGSMHSRTNFPLTLAVSAGRTIGAEVGYDTGRFDAESIQGIWAHLQFLLEETVRRPSDALGNLRLFDATERRRLLRESQGETGAAPDRWVHELFSERAQTQPDAPALLGDRTAVSYGELEREANRLARYLIRKGVGPESVVGVYLRRSREAIAAILGILKAGGAYLPLDPSWPFERIRFTLSDSRAMVVLTQEELRERLSGYAGDLVSVDGEISAINAEESTDPGAVLDGENLAYVIYTSGSTGTPKGVAVTHRSLTNHARHVVNLFGLEARDRILQFLSLSFDAAGEELYPALTSGAALVIHPEPASLTPREMNAFCDRHRVSILHLPAAYWHQWAGASPGGPPSHVRWLLVGGETPSRAKARSWSQNARGHVGFVNAYGPTETTISATMHVLDPGAVEPIPIGVPLPNMSAYLLDATAEPVPQGIAGELYIGGIGVARGYAGNAALTAERFLPDPFSSVAGSRMYRTGDRARRRSDGALEFMGRLDEQLKLRGFRIEPGEIASRLADHPAVRECVVVTREDASGEKALVAYLLLRPEADAEAEALREFLSQRVPDYMIPAAFVVLEEFPLTPTGKIDRRALPAPATGQTGRAPGSPRTPTQELLAGIWSEILGVQSIGPEDDFFALGGHSLRATQLASRIAEVFAVDLPLKTVFEQRTLRNLAQQIDERRASGISARAPALARTDRSARLPLSFAQQRLWFIDQLEPGGTFYNIPAAFRLKGPLDASVLERCFTEIVRRHEVLRTTFRSTAGKPHAEIGEAARFALPVLDITTVPAGEREEEVRRRAREEARHVFGLSTGPMFRVLLVRLAQEEHVLLVTMHHIVSDGWSQALMVREVADLYRAFARGEASPLMDPSVQYVDYAAWQRQWLQGEELEAQIAYWKDQLSGMPPVIELPTDRPRPAVQTFRGARRMMILPREIAQNIRALGQKEGATPFMTLLAAFQTLLARYSRSTDIAVGSPIAGRRTLQLESLIGFFVNTLVLRTRLEEGETFRSLLQKVRATTLGAFDHQDVPFEKLVEELHPVRDLSHSPLFQVMFVLQNIPWQRMQAADLTLESLEVERDTSSYDLTLLMQEVDEGYVAEFEFNTDLFDAATIERMQRHFRQLLSGVLEDPDRPLASVNMLPSEERQRELVDWNATSAPFPATICVHEWYERHAREHPEAVALTFATAPDTDGNLRSMSYAELNARANQLARRLRECGVGCESLVGVCMERSLETVIAILGTLKAGGAFVPLDPSYPAERLAYMMGDSEVRVLLTQEALMAGLPATTATCICLDTEWASIGCLEDSDLGLSLDPDNLAYVIYTSGSTGRPKGTMLRHRGLCNLATVQAREFDLGPGSRVLQFSSLSFDASVWEMVMALLSGSTLCLVHQDIVADPPALAALMEHQAVTTITLPPSVLSLFPDRPLSSLHVLVTAGEKCTGDLVDRWGVGRKFFNAYGPTETTVCASMHLCAGSYPEGPPLGRPLANFDLYILDRNLEPLPVGVPGELCVGGIGLARGYLHRPDLTAERFVPHPFSPKPGERVYRTGDLCRYREDGNVEFLGRIDDQVKVRGFRIELGEIEAVLSRHPAVREACVLARQDRPGDLRLVAYVVRAGEEDVSPADMKAYLRERLPEYMVPSTFVTLDAMPLTPSLKVDRKSLPAPAQDRPDLAAEYVPPRDDQEQKLVDITRELLPVERVGVHDSFFDLGGHSLLATQFVSRVRDTMGVDLPLRTLFEKPTVAELSMEIDRLREAGLQPQAPAIKRVSREAARMKRSEITS